MLHSWNLTPKEAIALQKELAGNIIRTSKRPLESIRRVAGLDVSYEKSTDSCHAAVVVYDRFDGVVLEESGISRASTFPYVPGLLSFRETPPLLEAIGKLKIEVDAFLADAQGIAHPRRMGLACHVGLWTGVPTVGCAKSILVGEHGELRRERGSRTDLVDPRSGEILGVVLRTRDGTAPVYVSVGHNISQEDAAALVMDCARGFRLPEPIRRAHALSNRIRKGG